MRKELQQRLEQMIAEEQETPVDQELLGALVRLASSETLYWSIVSPDKRNALNQFFQKLEDMMISEIAAGSFGGRVILQMLLITSFEVGYNAGEVRLLGDDEDDITSRPVDAE